MTPMRFQIREELAQRSPEERAWSDRSRFWRRFVVWTLGILAMAMAAAQIFLR